MTDLEDSLIVTIHAASNEKAARDLICGGSGDQAAMFRGIQSLSFS
jgi:hypothetical protein